MLTGLGFNIKGGTDVPYIKEDTGIFIAKIRETGAAKEDGRLNEGDKIIEVGTKQKRWFKLLLVI